MEGAMAIDERVVCLSGLGRTGRIDTLFVTSPRRDFPWLKKNAVDEMHRLGAGRVLARVIDVALHLAAEGREGKPIGTIFVLGQARELERYVRQLVLNPCAGHPQKVRNIHRAEFFETIREFAALDGAFVLNDRGVVLSAGTYLEAPSRRRKLPPGLGARHAAALSVTAATGAVATVVSSSSGKVTVFFEGRTILELEKPEPPVKQ
jgi:DNA integrity scanning protein DisA with diadenylate cyclase activity